MREVSFMKAAAMVGALVLLAANLALAQNQSHAGQADLIVLSSSDAPGELSIERLNSCLLRLAREWKQDEKGLPKIVVFHVSKKAAQTALIDQKVEVRQNRSISQSGSYYELWLVDMPTIPDYVLALENILEDHFQFKPTDDQRKQVMTRVARVQNATLSVYEGK